MSKFFFNFPKYGLPSLCTTAFKTSEAQRNHISRMAVTFTVLLVSVTVAHAQLRFEEDFDDEDKPWQEIAIQLPAAPLPENLLPFYVSATARQSFALDAKSLTVGADDVVRYTLVATSAAGAKNVSYEGIRCQSFERKLYAFGQRDGSWTRSRRDKWERIMQNAANRQHATLAQDYFCQQLTVAGDAKVMLERIRMQQPMRNNN